MPLPQTGAGPSIPLIIAGILIVVLTVYAVARKVDVRLALVVGGLALGACAGQPLKIVQTFLSAFSEPKFIVPICSAMGFSYVLRYTQCDRHLVHLLASPLRRIRLLLIPGAVFVGFLVNIPIISQTGTAVAVGPVMLPILLSARLTPVTAGAALVLGASVGGELLNPGAPEFRAVITETEKATLEHTGVAHAPLAKECVESTTPLAFIQLAAATLIFWIMSVRAEARHARENTAPPAVAGTRPPHAGQPPPHAGLGPPHAGQGPPQAGEKPPAAAAAGIYAVATDDVDVAWRINPFKAFVPLLPLVILFLTAPPWQPVKLAKDWLVDAKTMALPDKSKADEMFDTRLIALAMLVGVAAAAATMLGSKEGRRASLGTARAFFEGAGYGFAEIIAIIVAASCFADGIKLVGFGELIGHFIGNRAGLLIPTAGLLALAFAFICGSGVATAQGLFGFVAGPAVKLGVDPLQVGAVFSLGAAAGRTGSPVSAVMLMCSRLSGVEVTALVKRVALPLIGGTAAAIIVAMIQSKL